MRLMLMVIAVVLVSGCGDVDNTSAHSIQKPFFDLRAYFQGQISGLTGTNGVRKRVSANGKTEEKTFADIDFGRELSMFLNSDINRPAWLDKYKIDTLRIENDSTRSKMIAYTTANEQLKTKDVKVYLDKNDVPVEIDISNVDKSAFSDWRQDMTYRAGRGYRISNDQHFIFSKDSKVTIDADFVKK